MADGRRGNTPPMPSSLDPAKVALINQRALAGWKYREIAESVGVSIGAVNRYAPRRHGAK